MGRLSIPAKGVTAAVLASALALSGCTADNIDGAGAETRVQDTALSASPRALPAPGGVIRRGNSFATMAAQYTPRAGSVVATGASAWVEPAPAPAFVAAGPPPPADPPVPPPAAVANRQPPANSAPARPPEPASDIARPEAAAPDAQSASRDLAVRDAGLELFNTYSCGACHALADAGAGGSIGPSLDRNPRLARAFAIDVITNGRGAMPSFAGQMTDDEIAILADYIVQFSHK